MQALIHCFEIPLFSKYTSSSIIQAKADKLLIQGESAIEGRRMHSCYTKLVSQFSEYS
jgi:hypothetical protein